jgi:hypothetical protein
MLPPGPGGERLPDAELKMDRAVGNANLANPVIQVDQPGLLTLGIGGPDSQRGISLCQRPDLALRGPGESDSKLVANENPCQEISLE